MPSTWVLIKSSRAADSVVPSVYLGVITLKKQEAYVDSALYRSSAEAPSLEHDPAPVTDRPSDRAAEPGHRNGYG